MIYQASPIPFSDSHGIFKESKVSLSVFDLHGRQVATLDEKLLQPEKYEVTWNQENELPNGYYFIALKINDLQVHYIKVIRNKSIGY